MPNTYSNLNDLFTAIADEIRTKKGYASSVKIKADNFPTEISGMPTAGTSIADVYLTDDLYEEADFVNTSSNTIMKSVTFSSVAGVAYYLMVAEVTRSHQVVGTGLFVCNDSGYTFVSAVGGTVINDLLSGGTSGIRVNPRLGTVVAQVTVSKDGVNTNQYVSIRVYAIT